MLLTLPPMRIVWTSPGGEEHEEVWPTPDAFRAWAETERLTCAYVAYDEDEDGDWVVVDKGVTGLRPRGPGVDPDMTRMPPRH